MAVSLNNAVGRAVVRRWPQRGSAWTRHLAEETEVLSNELDVRLVRTFAARYAFVAEAVAPDGATLVVKSSPAPDAGDQAAVLQRLAEVGVAPAVRLVKRTATAVWSVTESVSPGDPLSSARLDETHIASALNLLRSLATAGSGPPGVPDLVPWIRNRLTAPPADDQPPGRGPAPLALREQALAVLDELLPVPPGRLCHGDLSLGNVLWGAERLWVVDPRGLNGEPAYDVAVVALKACAGHVDGAEHLAARLADGVDLDAERARRWVGIAAAATV